MNLDREILALAEKYEPYLIDCRRQIHRFAEVASEEKKTRALILREAQKLGLPCEEVPATGLIVRLDAGRPGKTVALRADMDALPIPEDAANLRGPKTCRSEQANTCHACGHDAHTAMLLGAMQVLTELRAQLKGTVLFCFEEGEERGSGVVAMLAALEKYHPDCCWGIHVWADLPEGRLAVEPGPRMAGAALVDVTFRGRGGHGSRPDQSVNPLFCAANFLNNLCVAFSQQITTGSIVTMGLTMLHCGEAPNIIDDTATVKGSYRFFSAEEGQKALQITANVAQHTAAMHGCAAEIPGSMKKILGDPVVNDEALSASAKRVLQEMLPAGTVTSSDPWYASESFSRWTGRYPGCLAFLGIRNPEEGYGAAHHNAKFDLNERILKIGTAATARVAAAWANESHIRGAEETVPAKQGGNQYADKTGY